jgi:hypothetical protein
LQNKPIEFGKKETNIISIPEPFDSKYGYGKYSEQLVLVANEPGYHLFKREANLNKSLE